MPDNAVQAAPWWAQYAATIGIALIGSGALLTEGVRKWRSGYGKAEARNLNAQAELAEANAIQLSQTRSVEFERVLNERTFRNMDMLEKQIKHLSELVEAQNVKMDSMEKEIIELRRTLDDRTSELNEVRSQKQSELPFKLMVASDGE
jgi:DNA gyrase/topoisomerase IV subunit A